MVGGLKIIPSECRFLARGMGFFTRGATVLKPSKPGHVGTGPGYGARSAHIRCSRADEGHHARGRKKHLRKENAPPRLHIPARTPPLLSVALPRRSPPSSRCNIARTACVSDSSQHRRFLEGPGITIAIVQGDQQSFQRHSGRLFNSDLPHVDAASTCVEPRRDLPVTII